MFNAHKIAVLAALSASAFVVYSLYLLAVSTGAF
jgi:hypothetical protein